MGCGFRELIRSAPQYLPQLKALTGIRSLPPHTQTLASQSYGKAFEMMMVATVPFVAVGFFISLTAEEADLGRKAGKKSAICPEDMPDGPYSSLALTSISFTSQAKPILQTCYLGILPTLHPMKMTTRIGLSCPPGPLN